jgi:DNA-binding transcriptional regulator YiaG
MTEAERKAVLHFAQSVFLLRAEVAELRKKRIAALAEADHARLRANAAEKLRQNAPLTRPEAAAFLGKSTRTLQRMEAYNELPRCRGKGRGVTYPARDIERLASAR